jgi:hypothetical protein
VLAITLPSLRSCSAVSQCCSSVVTGGHIVLYCRDATWRRRQCAFRSRSSKFGALRGGRRRCKANVANSRNVAVDPQSSGLRPGPEQVPVADAVAVEPGLGEGTEAGEISDELWKLLVLVPEHIGQKLVAHAEIHNLVEIVLDLGRRPLARFPSGDWFISETKVTAQDLQHAISMVLAPPQLHRNWFLPRS